MMVSHQHRCIFAHVPKCAGTAIRSLLDLELVSPPYWHCSWPEAERALGRATLDSYFKFAVVRNPWDRVVSAWRMFLEKEWCRQERDYDLAEFIRVAVDDSIAYRAHYTTREEQAEWERTVENIRHHTLPAVHPYYGVVGGDGEIAMDEVIDFDRLDDGLDRVQRRLELRPQRLRRENSTCHAHYGRYFDDEMRAAVERSFAADIRKFGFSFCRET